MICHSVYTLGSIVSLIPPTTPDFVVVGRCLLALQGFTNVIVTNAKRIARLPHRARLATRMSSSDLRDRVLIMRSYLAAQCHAVRTRQQNSPIFMAGRSFFLASSPHLSSPLHVPDFVVTYNAGNLVELIRSIN
eukprot:Phypoly_transcript_09686.p1 GENE.Phypoly_transcript_09686~~Phypoly_transcript_09686.p1  ORF type:complete len:134 (-),score=9.66 Phypoly_transcript_09686:468-869(-)